MSDYRSARVRYRRYRMRSRELLEEEALATLLMRVDVVSIDDDILRRVRRDWYEHAQRRVGWDWERDVIVPLHGSGARAFDFALLVQGQLCGMAAARVSQRKRWLSLTHIEGAPGEHPLKGKVLPLVVTGLYIYRAVISRGENVGNLGIRALNPLDEALGLYKSNGYTVTNDSKWLRAVEIEPRVESLTPSKDDHGSQAQRIGSPSAQDGAGGAHG